MFYITDYKFKYIYHLQKKYQNILNTIFCRYILILWKKSHTSKNKLKHIFLNYYALKCHIKQIHNI